MKSLKIKGTEKIEEGQVDREGPQEGKKIRTSKNNRIKLAD